MHGLMKNMPKVGALGRSKVDLLSTFSNSSNIWEASWPSHGGVDQVGTLKVFADLPAYMHGVNLLNPNPAWKNLLELQAGHSSHDLSEGKGDVVNLLV